MPDASRLSNAPLSLASAKIMSICDVADIDLLKEGLQIACLQRISTSGEDQGETPKGVVLPPCLILIAFKGTQVLGKERGWTGTSSPLPLNSVRISVERYRELLPVTEISRFVLRANPLRRPSNLPTN